MGSLGILIRRDLRKRPGQVLAVAVLTVLAAALLNAALVLSTAYAHNIDRRALEWRSPTALAVMTGPVDGMVAELRADPAIKTVETTPAHSTVATLSMGSHELSTAVQLINMDAHHELGLFEVIDELTTPVADPVWVPQVLAAGDGYQLGDRIVLNTAAGEADFRIQGFIEGLYGGAPGTGMLIFAMPTAQYEAMSHPGFFPSTLVAVEGADAAGTAQALDQAIRTADRESGGAVRTLITQDQQLMKHAATISVSIFVAILVALALIISAVAALVIRFVLRNVITTDMTSIGALRAAGHTTGGIIASLVSSYVLTTAVAASIGVGLSYPTLLDTMELSFREQNGITWQPRFDWLAASITVGAVLTVIALTTGLAAWQLRKVTTVAALRGGIATHSASRTRLPLDQTRGRLATVLGVKAALRQAPQSSIVATAIAAVAFTACFSLGMVSNLLGDTAIELLAGDVEDVGVQVRPDADAEKVLAEIAAMPGVDEAIFSTMIGQNNGGLTIGMIITPDPAALPGKTLVEGRLPAHVNEIAIGGRLADVAQLAVGDHYKIDLGNGAHEYLVTGLTSSAMHMGQNLTISTAGYQLLDPSYIDQTITIRTSIDPAELVEQISAAHVGELVWVVDQRTNLEAQLQGYLSLVPIAGGVVTVLSILVTALVVGLVVNTILVRSHRELGIKKAMGFTNGELGVQTRWTILPPVGLGALVGVAAGAVLTNPLLTMMLRGVGILRVDLTLDWTQVVGVAVAIVAFAAAITWASGLRIRRVSAYALITE